MAAKAINITLLDDIIKNAYNWYIEIKNCLFKVYDDIIPEQAIAAINCIYNQKNAKKLTKTLQAKWKGIYNKEAIYPKTTDMVFLKIFYLYSHRKADNALFNLKDKKPYQAKDLIELILFIDSQNNDIPWDTILFKIKDHLLNTDNENSTTILDSLIIETPDLLNLNSTSQPDTPPLAISNTEVIADKISENSSSQGPEGEGIDSPEKPNQPNPPYNELPFHSPIYKYFPSPKFIPEVKFKFLLSKPPPEVFSSHSKIDYLDSILLNNCYGASNLLVREMSDQDAWIHCDRKYFIPHFDEKRSDFYRENPGENPLAKEIAELVSEKLQSTRQRIPPDIQDQLDSILLKLKDIELGLISNKQMSPNINTSTNVFVPSSQGQATLDPTNILNSSNTSNTQRSRINIIRKQIPLERVPRAN